MSATARPSLLPITPANAARLETVALFEIPDFTRVRGVQCTVAFSPDGNLLVAACGESPVTLWDIPSRQLRAQFYDPSAGIIACAFSPDGRRLACGGFDMQVTLWDPAAGERLGLAVSHAAPVWDLAFSPDGLRLASCSLGLAEPEKRAGDIRLSNLADGSQIWIYPALRDNLGLSFHPDGKTLAYGALRGQAGLLDAATGEPALELAGPGNNVGGLAFSPSGRWLAAGSDDRSIYVWLPPGYDLAAQLSGHTHYVNGVTFHPDETLLVSGSHDRTVGVWDLEGRRLLARLEGHTDAVLRPAFSPDGTLIASVSWDGTVRLWGVIDR